MLGTHPFPHPNTHLACVSILDWISASSSTCESDEIQSKVDKQAGCRKGCVPSITHYIFSIFSFILVLLN